MSIPFNRLFIFICFLLVILNLPLTLHIDHKSNNSPLDYNFTKSANIINLFLSTKALTDNIKTKILQIVKTKHMQVDFSKRPKYQQRIKNNPYLLSGSSKLSRATINAELKRINSLESEPPITFSYYIPFNNQWLNFSFEKHKYPLLSFFTALLELSIIFIALTRIISVQRFIRPWKRIVRISKKFGLPVQTHRIALLGPAVIKESTNLMEAMVNHIDNLLNDKVTTIASLSHDIRTPLTRAEFYLQKITDKTLQNNLHRQFVEIQHYLNETLNYAKQDHQDEPKRKLDIVSLVETICSEMQDIKQDVKFNSDVKQFPILGQRVSLKRAIQNLIENGIKYGDSVIVNIGMHERTLKLQIIDKGKGLPEDSFRHVIKPFQRHETHRQSETPGTGLGLTIAKSIIEKNQGKLLLKNSQHFGLEICITWSCEPQNNEEESI